MLTLNQIYTRASAIRRQRKRDAERRRAKRAYERKKLDAGILKLFAIAREEKARQIERELEARREEHRRYREENYKRARRSAAAEWTCAKCGKTSAGVYVRLGGRSFCPRCAPMRRMRLRDEPGLQMGTAIPTPSWTGAYA